MSKPSVDIADLAHVFKALSDETRLRIVRLLMYADEGLCVCELVSALELPQYQVSRHLRVLKDSDIVTVERRGTWSYYHIDHVLVPDPVFTGLKEVFDSAGWIGDRDRQRLDQRLSLRSGGLCVVGFIDAPEIRGARV
ncbi:MAG: ArsR/SmtB family transcription factor [Spirochaetota bacterium]